MVGIEREKMVGMKREREDGRSREKMVGIEREKTRCGNFFLSYLIEDIN